MMMLYGQCCRKQPTIKMVVDVNGAVPARSSVMDAIPDYCEGGTLYLYRQQLESGISFLRPYPPAHMTIYDAMASVIGNIYAGADPATELHDAAAASAFFLRSACTAPEFITSA